jgi:hypothetical protein
MLTLAGPPLRKEACSFLKKRPKKLLLPAPAPRSRHQRHRETREGIKRFLLLFFKKEGLSYPPIEPQ